MGVAVFCGEFDGRLLDNLCLCNFSDVVDVGLGSDGSLAGDDRIADISHAGGAVDSLFEGATAGKVVHPFDECGVRVSH